jgi:hypothetical protein
MSVISVHFQNISHHYGDISPIRTPIIEAEVFLTSASITRVRMGEMSEMYGLFGWCNRDMSRFLVFPVGGIQFSLQDLLFSPIYFVAFFICMVGQFDF